MIYRLEKSRNPVMFVEAVLELRIGLGDLSTAHAAHVYLDRNMIPPDSHFGLHSNAEYPAIAHQGVDRGISPEQICSVQLRIESLVEDRYY